MISLKQTLLTFTFMLVSMGCLHAQEPNFMWATKHGGSTAEEGNDIAVDASGNVYTTGYFTGTLDFDPGAGTANLTSDGNDDIFISKVDASGNFVWAKKFGSTYNNNSNAVSVDGSGNVLMAGNFRGTVDFDPNAGINNLTATNNDAFVVKLDANGNLVWVSQFGGASGNTYAEAVVSDASDNVYAVIHFNNTADFDPGAGINELTAVGYKDIAIVKLDASGSLVWAKSIGSVWDDLGKDIILDGNGNIYITGHFKNTADFDPGAGTAELTSNGGFDIFVAKYDNNGNYIWAKQVGSTFDDNGNAIGLDDSGNAYITGYFRGTVDFDPSAGVDEVSASVGLDVYILKLTSTGDYAWVSPILGSSNNVAYDLEVDRSGNVYTTGQLAGTADFDPTVNTQNFTSSGDFDIFLSKFNTKGEYLWAGKIGSTLRERGYSITLDENSNMYLTGSFSGGMDFDPSSGISSLSNSGQTDVFIMKLEQPVVNIPDPNFKNILLADASINTIDDGEITFEEAESFTGEIDVTSSGISDLTGIEAFTNITKLVCLDNSLTSLDLSSNTSLTFLNASLNDLGSLDVSFLTNLEVLSAYNTLLTQIDVSNNLQLRELYLPRNDISTLDISANLQLEKLSVDSNNLSSLDLSNNPNLIMLWCNYNNITSLDLSDQLNLELLHCYGNGLQSLNMRNGNNSNIVTGNFRVNNNSLACISVTDVAYAETNWTNIDAGVVFKLACDPNEPVNIPDANFKAALLADASINTTADGEITYGEAEAFTGRVSVENSSINDLTGIEAFLNITELIAWSNNISSVDLKNNTQLTTLELNNNQLNSIDLTTNSNLTSLILGDNPLADLDISNNLLLERLNINNTEISSLDISQHVKIFSLFVKTTPLTEIDVSNQADLVDLRISNSNISVLDISNNAKLTFIEMNLTPISVIDITNNPELLIVDAIATDLTNLNTSANPKLRRVRVGQTQISLLDLSSNPELTNVDVSSNTNLTSLNIANGANQLITSFNAISTPNLSCVTVDDVAYAETNFTLIDNTTSFSTNCNNTSNDIVSFELPEQVSSATIDAVNHTVDVTVGPSTALTNLVPTFTISTGASVNPESGVAQDFSTPVLYTVTAENPNAEQDWTVTVIQKEAQIITFDPIPNQDLGDETLSLEATASSGLEVSYTILSGPATVNGNIISFIDKGTITVEASQSGNATYAAAAPVTQSFNVLASQLITFDPIADQLLSDGTLTLSATATSGLDVSYSVVSGPATVSGNVLTFNNVGTITVEASQSGNELFFAATPVEQSFNVIDNEAPTAIALSSSLIDENNAVGDVIGSFSTTDPDAGDAHTYSLVTGTGDSDNASFTISGSDLQATEAFDFETKSSYSIRVETNDGNGGTFEDVFTISVTDVNEAPTAIALSSSSIDENNAVGDVIGSFSTTDPDAGDTHSYSLVAGTGDTDNTSFTISGADLQAAEGFDFETKASYSVRVATIDAGGLSFEQDFTISINDVNEQEAQTITFNAIADQFLEEGSITLTATASSGLVVEYAITSGPATVSADVITFTGVGSVTVEATQPGNIDFFAAEPVTQTFEIVSVTSTPEVNLTQLRLYPNPSSETLNVVNIDQQVQQIEVLDTKGQRIYQMENPRGEEQINITNWQEGIYMVIVQSATDQQVIKFIKK